MVIKQQVYARLRNRLELSKPTVSHMNETAVRPVLNSRMEQIRVCDFFFAFDNVCMAMDCIQPALRQNCFHA